MPNYFKEIINKLEKQKAAIERALSALREMDDSEWMEVPHSRKPKKVRRKRTLSAEARQRISAAQRKRWAAVKKGTKKAA
jgi:primosomal protein N'